MTHERIGVTRGLRGWFAVLYDTRTMEPIETGFGSYEKATEAAVEAAAWAAQDSIPVEPSIDKLLTGIVEPNYQERCSCDVEAELKKVLPDVQVIHLGEERKES